ncbi:MAG: flagellar export chaperone FlgN [Clostridia bacterium]|nr:flagellar export chaperone FlgN [Clostridia bacterium]
MKVKELNNHLSDLTQGFELQLAMYRELLLLTENQEQALNEDQIDKLLELLQSRQEIIDKIDALNKKIDSVKLIITEILHKKEFSLNRINELVHTHSSFYLAKTFAEISNLLTTINQLDNSNQEKLAEKLQDVKVQYNKIQEGKYARQAYLDIPEQYPEPRFFDKKK